ncbi:MAG: hypothetical protein AAF716_05800 [Cyanobacteria bacterium P01_D01_bin.1]
MVLIFSLVGGLLIAVVLQLVFADLGIALGLSLLNLSPRRSVLQATTDKALETETTDVNAAPSEENASEADELANKTREKETQTDESDFPLPITHLLGFSVAFGLSLVIFIGALLSVEFSGLLEPRRGIIFGLIFWSTYWLLFIWACSTTIAGIADSLVGGAITSGRRLISTVKQSLIKSNETKSANENSFDSNLSSVAEQQTAIKQLTAEVSKLADKQKEIPDLLDSQKDALFAQLDAIITERLTEQGSKEFEQPAPSESTTTEATITEAATTEAVTTEPSQSPPLEVTASSSSGLLSELPSWQQIARSVIDQVDLSNWDIETLLQQLPVDAPKPSTIASQIRGPVATLLPETLSRSEDSALLSNLTAHSTKSSTAHSEIPQNETLQDETLQAIQTKLENYCRYTSLSALTPEKLFEKVCLQLQEHDLLEKDFLSVQGVCSKETLNIGDIETVLSRRQNLTAESRKQLIDALESAWPAVLPRLEQETEPQSKVEDSTVTTRTAYQTIDELFQSIDWGAVSLEDIKPGVRELLTQLEQENSLESIDWQALISQVDIHHDMKEELTNWLETALSDQLQSARPRVIRTAKNLSEHFSERITDYLKHREKSALHPVKAARGLSQVIGSAIATLPHPSNLAKLTDFLEEVDISFDQVLWDKDRWRQTLENRKDMTTAEIQQILDWGEQIWQPKAKQIANWLQATQTEIRKHLSLLDKNLPERNPLGRKLLVSASEQLKEQVSEQSATVQAAVSEQITAVKEDIQTQVSAVTGDIQTQLDSGRKQVVIAAWWLFIALVSSGSAAAGAGWLATNY